jgi:hypothetical protein
LRLPATMTDPVLTSMAICKSVVETRYRSARQPATGSDEGDNVRDDDCGWGRLRQGCERAR